MPEGLHGHAIVVSAGEAVPAAPPAASTPVPAKDPNAQTSSKPGSAVQQAVKGANNASARADQAAGGVGDAHMVDWQRLRPAIRFGMAARHCPDRFVRGGIGDRPKAERPGDPLRHRLEERLGDPAEDIGR